MPPPADLVALGVFAAVLLGAVGVGEGLRAWADWPAESSRRAVHVGVGLATAMCPPLFSSSGPVYGLAAVFVVANAVAVRRRLFPGMHAVARRSWGTAVFPIALIAALWVCWTLGAGRVFVLQTAFAVLALADPAASLVGTRVRRPGRFAVGGQTKSVAGSAAFAVVAGSVTAGALALVAPPSWGTGQIVVGAVTVALVGAAAEAVGQSGWDNLAVVLSAVVPLVALHEAPEAAGRFALALVVAAGFGAAAWRAGALDASGALAGVVFAWMLVALGGAAWAAPALAFFVLSSALSHLPRRGGGRTERVARDAQQVLANGGVAAGLLALWAVRPAGATAVWDTVLFCGFAGSLAAAAADTWATETGTRWGGATRRLGVGRAVAPGTSGGVSAVGTAGALGGALSVALAAAWASPLPAVAIAGIAGAGLVGAAVDTGLGATLQARFRRPDGTLAEQDGGAAGGVPWPLASGVRGLGNSAVNLACTLAGALAGAAGAWLAG